MFSQFTFFAINFGTNNFSQLLVHDFFCKQKVVKFQVSQNKELLSTKQSFISIPVKSCECFSPKPVIDLRVKKASSAWNEICFAAEGLLCFFSYHFTYATALNKSFH